MSPLMVTWMFLYNLFNVTAGVAEYVFHGTLFP